MPDFGVIINFGNVKPLRARVFVVWSDQTEHFHGVCDTCEWESLATWNRFLARRWALKHTCPKDKP